MSMTEFLLALYKSITVLKLCSFSDFNVNEYDRLNKCENGVDMTWIVPSKFGMCNNLLPIDMEKMQLYIDKLLAFMGPVDESSGDVLSNFSFFTDYFKANNVQVVVRCNNPNYDAEM